MTHAKNNAWFDRARPARSIVPIARFVPDSEHVFALKPSGYGRLFSLAGVDEESLTDQEIESVLRNIEGALRGLPEGSALYQYMSVSAAPAIPRQQSYANPVTESFVNDRLCFLEDHAGFRRITLYWCLTVAPLRANPFEARPKDQRQENMRLLLALEKASAMIEEHLGAALGIAAQGREETFRFFSRLFNLEDWTESATLSANEPLDAQIARSGVSWHPAHLQIGQRYVQMLNMISAPASSRPCTLAAVMGLPCDTVLCSTWRPVSRARASKEGSAQESWAEFWKVGIFQRVMAGKNFASLDHGARAQAAGGAVNKLGDLIEELDEKAQGKFSVRLMLSSRDLNTLRSSALAAQRIFVEAQADVMEETLGNLSAFYAMFPGNQKFGVFDLWLGEHHHARLSPVFAPSVGHPQSEDLGAEYLNVFETRQGTPYFQDAYVNGVRVQLILGPTGSGKSVHASQMLALEQKYGGFTYVFDIGNSYESTVELYGGRVDRVGLDGPRINPFALEPTEKNLKFLYSFVKLLLLNGGATLRPEDEDLVYKCVRGMYHLAPETRRLAHLLLPPHLDRYMAKWVGKGVYSAIFDNVEDSLTLSRIQCWDFAGLTRQYQDLIEPLMVWLLRRIDDVVYDPANLGVPKHIVIEEIDLLEHEEQAAARGRARQY